MAPRHTGTVARARIISPDQGNLFGSPAELLLSALKPGFPDERYGRLWRLGQIHEDDGHLHGHLGFERQIGADLWDEDTQDFEPTPVPNGVASPFVIRLADFAVVFQPRKQEIRIESFISALRSILRSATAGEPWDVRSLTGETPFEQWRETVEYVTRLRFRVEDAELRRIPRTDLSEVIAQTQPQLATLELRAKTGIDTDSPLVHELLRHAENGLGDVVAEGRQGDPADAVRVWASSLHGESTLTPVPVDRYTGEASVDALVQQLSATEVIGEP